MANNSGVAFLHLFSILSSIFQVLVQHNIYCRRRWAGTASTSPNDILQPSHLDQDHFVSIVIYVYENALSTQFNVILSYSIVDPFCYLYFVSVTLSRLFIAALWSPAGKGLTSWFSSM